MKHKSVVILSDEIDVHADAIIDNLYKMDCDVIRINVSNLFSDKKDYLTFEIYNEIQLGEIFYNNRKLNFNNIDSILCRDFYFRTDMNEDFSKELINYERKASIYSFFRSLNCKWVNAPWTMDTIDNKPYQYSIAKKIGLKIPDTLITNNKENFVDFYNSHNSSVIIKQLSEINIFKEDKENRKAYGFHTNKVESEHIGQLNLLNYAPCLFQELIEKKGDIRVTIIGDKCFCCFIDSQSNEKTKLDFRLEDVPLYNFTLPKEVELRLIEMMNKLNIYYGAADFILSKNDELYFLEINTAGNYLWIEMELGLPISENIAKFLLI